MIDIICLAIINWSLFSWRAIGCLQGLPDPQQLPDHSPKAARHHPFHWAPRKYLRSNEEILISMWSNGIGANIYSGYCRVQPPKEPTFYRVASCCAESRFMSTGKWVLHLGTGGVERNEESNLHFPFGRCQWLDYFSLLWMRVQPFAFLFCFASCWLIVLFSTSIQPA